MKNRLITHFDSLSTIYDSYAALSRNPAIVSLLKSKAEEYVCANVLDVGTGTGNFGEIFSSAGASVIGLDININMLRKTNNKGIKQVCGDSRAMPFESNVFDMALSRQLLQYLSIDGIQQTLTEMRRVLANSGKLILHHISTPSQSTLKNVCDFMAVKDSPTVFLSCDDLSRLVTLAGFLVISREVHGIRVDESVENFCKVRNITEGEISTRLQAISGIKDFDLSYGDLISYIRYYSLIVATNE